MNNTDTDKEQLVLATLTKHLLMSSHASKPSDVLPESLCQQEFENVFVPDSEAAPVLH